MRVIAAARSVTRAQTGMAVCQLARITGGLVAGWDSRSGHPLGCLSERWPSRSVRCRASLCPGCGTFPLYAANGSGDAEAFRGLPGDLGDELEVLVQVQHGQRGLPS